MDFAYDTSGITVPTVRRFQVAATNTTLGVPYLKVADGGTGIVLATTTGATDAIGVNVDAAGTYVTAQQTANADTERTTGIIINHDAVYRMLLSGGAGNSVALTLYDVTTASTDGLAVTTGDDWSNPEFDEGTVWGYDGANALKARKITSTSTTAATVIVSFPYDTVVGDNFLRAPFWPSRNLTLQLTTNLDQCDASIAVGTGAPWVVVELLLLDIGGEGRTNSFVFAQMQDHFFGGNIT